MTSISWKVCLVCGQQTKKLSSHRRQNPACSLLYSQNTPPTHNESAIPFEIGNDTELNFNETPQHTNSGRRTSSRKRKAVVTYSETTRPYTNSVEENSNIGTKPTPDLSLNDYVTTYLSGRSSEGNDSSIMSPQEPNPAQVNLNSGNNDEAEFENEYWESLFLENSSVAAVAASPQSNQANVVSEIRYQNIGSMHTMPFSVQQKRIVTSPWDRSMARLYKICDNVRAPRNLCDKIMSQLREEMSEQQFNPLHPGITQRNACMHRLQNAIGASPPEKILITLESGSRVTVYRFPFMESYQRYLLSKPFSFIENLDVDPTDPFGVPPHHPNRLKEMHDGRWFRESYQDFLSSVDDPCKFVFTDLAIYADKTGTDKIEKNSLEPVIAFCPLLKKEVREHTSAHFLLGFIPNLSTSSSALRRGRSNRQGSKSMSVRDYHRCLEVLLSPLKVLQECQPLMYHRRGDVIKYARNFCRISAIVGDNKSHDMFVARIADYGSTTPRISRRCMTEFGNSTESNHSCKIQNSTLIERLSMGALGCVYGSYREADDSDQRVQQLQTDRSAGVFESRELRIPGIAPSLNFERWMGLLERQNSGHRKKFVRLRKLRQKLCQQILLKVFGCHAVDNAFFGLHMGSNKNGVFRATLADILHTLDEGIFPKLLKVVYDIMPDRQRSQIDDYVEYLFGNGKNRSGERSAYPRVSFTRGYTQLTLLSASERVGQLFVLAIILQTEKGQDLMCQRFDSEFDEKRREAQIRLGIKATPTDEEESNSPDSADESVSESIFDHPLIAEPPLGPSRNEIANFLRIIDLEYVDSSIVPSLDDHHKKLLETVLSKTVTSRTITNVDGIDLEPFLLDYRKVDIQDTTDEFANDIHALDFTPIPEIPIEEGRERCSIKLTMGQFGSLIETLLTFQAFLKYGTSLLVDQSGIAEYKRALQLLRTGLVETIDRGEGTNNWNLQKFLEMSHFLLDIIDYGSAAGFSTNPFERALKEWAKRPAATAQKRGDEIFSGQVCARLHEFFLIDSVSDTGQEPETHQDQEHGDIHLFCGNFRMILSLSQCKVRRVLASGKEHKIQIEFEDEVINWFATIYTESILPTDSQTEPTLEIQLFTEISIFDGTTNSRTKLRAHPNYQSAGPWYDFAYITYDEVGQLDASTYPCKLICFFKDPNHGAAMALVQEVEFQTTEQAGRDSQLFEHWRLRNRRNNETGNYNGVLSAIPAESIADRFYAIDTVPDGQLSRQTPKDFDILVVKYQCEQWPKSFLKSPEYFYNIMV